MSIARQYLVDGVDVESTAAEILTVERRRRPLILK